MHCDDLPAAKLQHDDHLRYINANLLLLLFFQDISHMTLA